MQHDADFTVWFPHEGPALVDDGQLAAAVGEINIAHADCKFTMELDHLIADGQVCQGLMAKPLSLG